MKFTKQFEQKNVIVLGLAKSGYNAALLLHKLGANVVVNDGKTPEDMSDVMHLQQLGMEVITGTHPDNLVTSNIDYLVKNPGISYDNKIVQQAISLNIPVLTDVELAYLVSLAPIVSITGSNGKTTTTTLVAEMLKKSPQYKEVCLAGNIGIPATTVAQNVTADDLIVMEMSSFQLMGIQQFRPKIAVIVNIYEAHLDYHLTRENYVEAKLNMIANQTADDYLVLNGDLSESYEFAKRSKAKVLYFSKDNENASIFVKDGWIVVQGERVFPVTSIQLAGSHNLENVLAATLVAKLLGQTNDEIEQVVSAFQGVAHRCQFVGEVNGRRFYNDSKATNILATQMALKGFDKNVVLIAGGLDRGNDFEELEPSLQPVKQMVVYGESKQKLAVSAQRQHIPVVVVDTLEEAVKVAYEQSAINDVILFSPACASWDQYDNFEKRGEHFVQLVKVL